MRYELGMNFKESDIDFIVDKGVREIIRKRFEDRKGGKDHPLKNLENDPVWLNEQKRIPITSVRCIVGGKDLIPVHKSIVGETFSKGKAPADARPVNYVKPGNNHHIALYEDEQGVLQETAVTFWEAVERKRYGMPVVIDDPGSIWDLVMDKGIDDPDFLSNLPKPGWKLVESLQQNELFIFRMDRNEIEECLARREYSKLSPNLYRVQKISSKDYFFRHHIETKLEKDSKETKDSILTGKMVRTQSFKAFKELLPVKVRISNMGLLTMVKND